MKKAMDMERIKRIEKIEDTLIDEYVKSRIQANLSQPKLSNVTGMNQPAIAKIENRHCSPNVFTLLRLLEPLNKTLRIVDMQEPH